MRDYYSEEMELESKLEAELKADSKGQQIGLEEEVVGVIKRDNTYPILLGVMGIMILIMGYMIVNLYIKNTQVESWQYSNGDQTGYNASYSNNQSTSASGGGCSGSGGGCGGAGGGCGSVSAGGGEISDPALEQEALAMYEAEFGSTEGLVAKVYDFGCHQEVSILDKDNNLVKKYTLRGGQLSLLQ